MADTGAAGSGRQGRAGPWPPREEPRGQRGRLGSRSSQAGIRQGGSFSPVPSGPRQPPPPLPLREWRCGTGKLCSYLHVVSRLRAAFETQKPGGDCFLSSFPAHCHISSLRNEHRPADGLNTKQRGPAGYKEYRRTKNHKARFEESSAPTVDPAETGLPWVFFLMFFIYLVLTVLGPRCCVLTFCG